MEAQMHRHHEDDPHGEHHGEKKSVLKKVKEKAKKIKDTIKKHGHGHEHGHEPDEEMVNDPEVHGASMYGSAVITGTNLPIQTGVNLEKPIDRRGDRYKSNVKNEVYTTLQDEGATRASGMGKMGPELGSYNPTVGVEGATTRPPGPEQMRSYKANVGVPPGPEQVGSELGSYIPKVEDAVVATKAVGPEKMGPKFGTSNPNVQGEGVTGGGKMGPAFGNYNPNVEDEGVTSRLTGPVILGPELGRYVDPNVEDAGVTTRLAAQHRTEPEQGRDDLNVKNNVYPNVEDTGTATTASGPEEMGMPSDDVLEPEHGIPVWSSPYTVDVETENIVETTYAEQPMVKIGPLENIEEDPHAPKNRAGEVPASNHESKVTDPTGEGGKEAEVSPLADRLSNLHVHDAPVSEQKSYTGTHDHFAPQLTPTEDQFTPVSSPITPSESLESPKIYDLANPGSIPHDTIAEKITSATSVIADKAVAAKNVVALKLGYGSEDPEGSEDTSKKAVSESAAEYAHKVAETLAPVYEKVTGAGSAILSKVHGGGGAGEGSQYTVVEETDKGVSVKEYLAVKLSPGDEDKALSEVITEALHKQKEGTETTGESKDVNKRELEAMMAAQSEGSSGGAVHRLKDAVGSWFGRSTGHDEQEVGGQQRRLQESGN